ncbi:MAG: FAD-dependent oxidoreductase [Thermoplasmatota archaeon]
MAGEGEGRVRLVIDGREVEADRGSTLLCAARTVGIYIPALCSHPDLPPIAEARPVDHVFRGEDRVEGEAPPTELAGCRLCLVDVEGRGVVTACTTLVEDGMRVRTETPEVREQRARNLVPILARHPHACLTCAQQEGCVREPCSSSVPAAERCCPKFGRCELQRVANYIGVRPETPKYVPRGLPVLRDDPLFVRDYNLCIGCARCVRACVDVRGVGALGFVFRGGERVVGTTVAPGLRESDCRFCGACVEVCPTGALMDRESYTEGEREAELVPCRSTCPVGVNVPEYVRLVSLGRPDEALEVIRERALLPLVLGHICLRPCEDKCRRGKVDEPVSIRELKRHAALMGGEGWRERLRPLPETGKRVAVVGSGPAGLSAAFLLSLKGHSVALIEREPRIGGVLDWGIPSFRLPREALERDLAGITRDVLVKTGVEVGRDVSLEELMGSFDAVLIATGLPRSRRMEIEGAGLEGVLWGLDFLRAYNAGRAPRVGKRTLVIGGGNVAVDVARAALRSGAEEVTMVCLESREAMPASPSELDEALDEGVEILPSWGPRRVVGGEEAGTTGRGAGEVVPEAGGGGGWIEDGGARDGASGVAPAQTVGVAGDGGGRVAGVELRRCTRVFDERGRFSPAFDDSVREFVGADTVIFAIGQDADLGFIAPELGIRMEGPRIVVDAEGVTTRRGVFAAGDIVRQPGSVVEAISSGRRAASGIDRYLGGDGRVEPELWTRRPPEPKLGRVEGFGFRKRAKPGRRRDRRGEPAMDGRPVELPLDPAEARAEASRCLQCDLRLTICKSPSPPERWLAFSAENVAAAPASEGVYILLDEKRETIKIAGVRDLRAALEEQLERGGPARFFHFEEDKMYTKKESELLQQYIQQHGRMPGGGEEDELF